jgi:hypothetical protein
MSQKIKIIAVPAGFAPEHIRKEWVGIEIPLAEDPIPEDKVVMKIGNQNKDGYQVKGTDAVKALQDAEKFEAAEFWGSFSSGNFTFKKNVCELI